MDIQINLNDFAAMDRAIFSEEELKISEKSRWTDKFYCIFDDSITFPIDHQPKTIEEHQLCHYILWMSIWANGLLKKPMHYFYVTTDGDYKSIIIMNRCFACEYLLTIADPKSKIPNPCPILVWRPCTCVTRACNHENNGYRVWKDLSIHNDYEIALMKAKEIATYIWGK